MTTNDAPFRFEQEGNLCILTLLPELNNVQWGEIDAIGTQILSSLESQSHPILIVDLSPLNYMGSAMVALIVRAWKATQPKKGRICVICPHAGVREVLKLAALDKVWDIVDDMDEARALVGAGRAYRSSGQSGSDSRGGLWIVVLILLIACGALITFAIKPELLGVKGNQEVKENKESKSVKKEVATLKTEQDDDGAEDDADSDTPENSSTPAEQVDKQPTPDKPGASSKEEALKKSTPEQNKTGDKEDKATAKKAESSTKQEPSPKQTPPPKTEPGKKSEADSDKSKKPEPVKQTKPEEKKEPVKPETK